MNKKLLKNILSILLISMLFSTAFSQTVVISEHEKKQFDIAIAFAQLTNENLKVKDSIILKRIEISADNYFCMVYKAKNEYGVGLFRETILTPTGKVSTSSSNPDSDDIVFNKLWNKHCVMHDSKNYALMIGIKTGFKIDTSDEHNYTNQEFVRSKTPNELLKNIINETLASPVSYDKWFPQRLCEQVTFFKLLSENRVVAHYQVNCSNYRDGVLLNLGNIPAVHSHIISCKFSKIEMKKEAQCK